jgi:RNA polymerase sigma factor (sigma-70 family)
VIRRFRGESSLGTYLTVVVASQVRDFRAARWGRWRPSAEARRLGPPAPRLERLVMRQGLSLSEAAEVLRSSNETSMSDRELADLLRRVPARGPMRPVQVSADALEQQWAPGDDDLEVEEERARVLEGLRDALEGLEVEDRLLLRMHFWEGLTIQAAARALNRDPKPLYKRMDRLRVQLRTRLQAAGIERGDALGLIG